MMASPFSYLPHELHIEILEKLPVKSLLRFKCVCKLWRSIIGTPEFARKQFENSKISSSDESIFIPIYSLRYSTYRFYSADPSSCHVRALQPMFKTPFRRDPFYLGEDIQVCSCDGLVLLSHGLLHAQFLWNPITNKFKEIPHPPSGGCSNYRFGYDSSIQDYKIVKINPTNTKFLVYILKANSWRTIKSPLPGCCEIYHALKSVFINGAVHFVCWHESMKLLCFNLAEERFTHLPLPPLDSRIIYGLQVLGGFLHVHHLRLDRDAEVWSMKEYGNEDSWVKISNIRNSSAYVPYSLMENGDLLVVENDNYISLRDMKKEVNRKLIQSKSGFGRNIMNEYITSYVGSLVTPWESV